MAWVQLMVAILSLAVLGFIGFQTLRISQRSAAAVERAERLAARQADLAQIVPVVETLLGIREILNRPLPTIISAAGTLPDLGLSTDRLRLASELQARLVAVERFRERLPKAVKLVGSPPETWTFTEVREAVAEALYVVRDVADPPPSDIVI